MTFLLLLALCCAGDVAQPAAPRVLPGANMPPGIEDITIDASRTNARGLQIVSVKLKLLPMHAIRFASQNQVKLVVTTRDPKTQVHVIYPIGLKEGGFCYKDEVAIQVLIQRAKGDQSPVEGRLDFRVCQLLACKQVSHAGREVPVLYSI